MASSITQALLIVATLTVVTASILPRSRVIKNGDSRIISGADAQPKQFPHQVAMYNERLAFCGGSVISDRWVLTAAHCAVKSQRFILFVGAHTIMRPSEEGRRVHIATKAIVHENYNATTLQHDVAVIKTLSKIHFNEWVSKIDLPGAKYANELFVNQAATVSGWGKTKANANGISPVLKYVGVTVISNEDCKNRYVSSEPIFETTLCCQGQDVKSTCNGDSGGPLIANIDGKLMQIGVVSFVSDYGCESKYPHGYSRLTKYVNWVQNATGIKV